MALAKEGTPVQATFQGTIYDSVVVTNPEMLTKLENSDEGVFRSIILPLIDTNLVQLLCSDKTNTRPSYMKRHIAAMLYLREKGISESFFLEHIHSDIAMQYAIGTELLNRQPFCEKTFQRLRASIRDYKEETGIDVYEQITHKVDLGIAEYMKLQEPYDEEFKAAIRIDSLMVDCHGASMTRLTIIYTVIAMAIAVIYATSPASLPESLHHYLEDSDKSKFTYYKGTIQEVEDAIALIRSAGIEIVSLANEVYPDDSCTDGTAQEDDNKNANKDSEKDNNDKANAQESHSKRLQKIGECRLLYLVQDLVFVRSLLEDVGETNSKEYELICRVIEDQTTEKDGKVIVKDKKDIKGTSLQNPYDEDATYRSKNSVGYHGYSAVVAEQYDQNGNGVIIYRQLEQNVYSDQAFSRDFLKTLKGGEKLVVCCDALFTSEDIHREALEHNIHMVCASSTGKAPHVIIADFQFSPDGKSILKCPYGFVPDRCNLKKDGAVTAFFTDGCCRNCEHYVHCGASIPEKRKTTSVTITSNQVYAAGNIKLLHNDKQFHTFVNKHNGVEGIPSVLRRKYRIDEVPYFGIDYARRYFYTSVTAFNINKLYSYVRKQRKAKLTAATHQQRATFHSSLAI